MRAARGRPGGPPGGPLSGSGRARAWADGSLAAPRVHTTLAASGLAALRRVEPAMSCVCTVAASSSL